MRRGPKPAKSKLQAKSPVTRKSQKDDSAKVRDLEKRLAEALAREKATSGILRVISSSPTDYQQVFDTIVRTAGVVCDAIDAVVWNIDGDKLVICANNGPIPGGTRFR